MRIVLWEHHFLGAGHLFRMATIARVLAERHEVYLLMGASEPALDIIPERVIKVPLPVVAPNKHADMNYIQRESSYDSLAAEDGGSALSALEDRRLQILRLIEELQPEVLVTEYFPFGRRLFALELIPAIQRLRDWGGRAVCSVRDILQGEVTKRLAAMPEGSEKEQTRRFHQDAVTDLNTWFDLLLVHGDENFLSLRKTLPDWMLEAIQIPLRYTGYVVRSVASADTTTRAYRPAAPSPEQLAARHGYVVVSVGSGGTHSFNHGSGAIDPSIAAWKSLVSSKEIGTRKMVIFAGSAAPEQEFQTLVDACPPPWFSVNRATADFVDWLSHADLSISRAGYNTCAELMATVTPSILLPSRKNTDQEARACAFARHGLSLVLQEHELTQESLRRAIQDGLRLKRPRRPAALTGAKVAAQIIEEATAIRW